MASAQLTLAPRIRAAAGHSWLDSRDRWLASHKNVVRSRAVATRLRYDEGGIDVGWSHRCGWRRHQSLLEDRVTRNNVGRVGRSDDWQNGADSPGSDRRAHRAEPDPSAIDRIRPIARGGELMALSSPRRGRLIMAPDHALEQRIFDAYQEVKRARRDGDYVAICGWMSVVDDLLDRCSERHAEARASTSA
jgi:hypothetical protein